MTLRIAAAAVAACLAFGSVLSADDEIRRSRVAGQTGWTTSGPPVIPTTLITRELRINRQRITEVYQIPTVPFDPAVVPLNRPIVPLERPIAAPVIRNEVAGTAQMKATVLTIREWTCGKQFTDDRGRRFQLMQGLPQRDKPGKLDGWLMQAADSPIYFFSKTGRMFELTSQPLRIDD